MCPAIGQAKKIAASVDYRRISVSSEVRAASRHCYLPESAENGHKWGLLPHPGTDEHRRRAAYPHGAQFHPKSVMIPDGESNIRNF